MSHKTHNNAIQSVESGTDLRFIQELLGHRNSKITGIYTYISTKNIRNIKLLLMIQRKKKSYFYVKLAVKSKPIHLICVVYEEFSKHIYSFGNN
jgi:hypothetical protein